VKADKIREEAKDDHDKRVTELNETIIQQRQTLHNNLELHTKDDHDKRVTELNETIIQQRQTLHNNLELHTKEEGQLAAGWENAENNYQSNLDSYDQEMHSMSEKIVQARKEFEEYDSQMSGLKEEYTQRVDEKRKRDCVKTLINKLQAVEDQKTE